ncbi:MAG: hypothetical protein KAT05_14055 [Spirochaetes bacterium]|nr:hypothetical protein [Spirochaetota bacterium]
MEVSSIFLGLLGITVSVTTFVFTYKQTIGARKERAKNVINEVNKMLYRNLILDDFIPIIKDLNRILSSKILEHRIKESDLPLEIDFLNTLYTKLIEDELIDSETKNKLISKIDEKIISETKQLLVEEFVEVKNNKDTSFFLVMALMSVFAGMLTFLLLSYQFKIPSFNVNSYTVEIFTTFILMITALLFTQNIIRQKSKEIQESLSAKSQFKEITDFENRVYKKLNNAGFKKIKKHFRLKEDGKRFIIDFYAQKNEQKYYIEVKNFRSIIPNFSLQKLEQISSEIKKADKKAKLILISKNKIIINDRTNRSLDNWDYILNEYSLDRLKQI